MVFKRETDHYGFNLSIFYKVNVMLETVKHQGHLDNWPETHKNIS